MKTLRPGKEFISAPDEENGYIENILLSKRQFKNYRNVHNFVECYFPSKSFGITTNQMTQILDAA